MIDTVNPLPIPTMYRGTQFRSRLEARWAFFFDQMEIDWRYEDEGYQLPSGWYVPDFLLPECGTFVEVRGDSQRVDIDDLATKAAELPALPRHGGEQGPRLMLVGPIPVNIPTEGDLGWAAWDGDGACHGWYGFGVFRKNRRPWWLGNIDFDHKNLLTPTHDKWEWSDALICYERARKERFWNPTQ